VRDARHLEKRDATAVGPPSRVYTSDIDGELHAVVSRPAGVAAGIGGVGRADDQPPHAALRLHGDVVSGLDLTAVLVPGNASNNELVRTMTFKTASQKYGCVYVIRDFKNEVDHFQFLFRFSHHATRASSVETWQSSTTGSSSMLLLWSSSSGTGLNSTEGPEHNRRSEARKVPERPR